MLLHLLTVYHETFVNLEQTHDVKFQVLVSLSTLTSPHIQILINGRGYFM